MSDQFSISSGGAIGGACAPQRRCTPASTTPLVSSAGCPPAAIIGVPGPQGPAGPAGPPGEVGEVSLGDITQSGATLNQVAQWNGTNWVPATVGGTGTVTQVDGAGGGTGLTLSGGPITGAGTLTLGGVLAVTSGGTGSGVAATGLANLGGVPTSRLVSAGTGLTGGGDLSVDRTFSVSFGATGTTACVGNDSRLSDARTPLAHTHPQSDVTNLVTDLAAKVPTSRLVSAGTGLTGGGDLSADRTLTVSFGTTGTTACVGNDARLSDARTPLAHTHPQSDVTNLVADLAAKALATRLISAGTGLTGGGDLSADRTLTVSFGTTGTTACVGNDARLSDARTPTAHTHPQSDVTNLTTDLAAKAPLASPTFTGTPPIVPDDPYDGTNWDGNLQVPTKNAIRDKIESMAAGGTRYLLLRFGCSSENGVDGATRYIGVLEGISPRNTATQGEIVVPVNGTVTGYHVSTNVGTNGSSESVNFYLRLNNTSDFGNATDQWNTSYTDFTVTGLSQSVTAGDRLVVKFVQPTYTTDPLSVRHYGWILIQVT